jgi:alanyl-tRNA synthetase
MQGDQIRSQFLKFFAERDHRVVSSSSLIPSDPTVLLTNAGMNQFKPYLLGIQEPPYLRATTSQKVFRAVDIDNVGHTARHLTFFEMLGNFSFGDYFKEKAIPWAFELITEGYGIEADRLWVTVYDTDDVAAQIWADAVGMPPDRIIRRGKFDESGEPANFWWMHTAGPCGPCSEIFVDRGAKYGPDGGPNVDEDRFAEIWNLVFMQDECDDVGEVLRPLPKQNIDTGSSLERVAMVLEGRDTVFETDLLRPLVAVGEDLSGHAYGRDERTDVGLRIMAEHGRATTFLMADGVRPSNEGRGYVLRRMIRRLVTNARRLGVERAVMDSFVEETVRLMGAAYPELKENEPFVRQVAASEEEHFLSTYRHGMALFEQEVERAKASGTGVFPAEAAFRLHDTFGFQQQLTHELAAEEGLEVDEEAFERLMREQRERARSAAAKGDFGEGPLGEVAAGAGRTEFLGYERLEADGRVAGLVADGRRVKAAGEGQTVSVVLDRTPLYAEGGGQVGDSGVIRTAGGGMVRVTDTTRGPGDRIVHHGVVESGEVLEGEDAHAEVDRDWRAGTARAHTATHVIHYTIRQRLGEHARQAGSLIKPGDLRFDFSHYEAVPKEIFEEIEVIANDRLQADDPVRAFETTFDVARNEGAIALFEEKYGDLVRVVEVGDYSIELCGGTHVHHTGEVGLVRLIQEGSIGSGMRRLEALVGPDAVRRVNLERRLLEEVGQALGAGDPAQAPERARRAVARIKQLESELGKIRRADQDREVAELAASATEVAGGAALWVSRLYEDRSADELREIALSVRGRLGGRPAAAVLGSRNDGKALIAASATNELMAKGIQAAQILQEAARAIGGGGGGKGPVAFAGGPRGDALSEAERAALATFEALVAGETGA